MKYECEACKYVMISATLSKHIEGKCPRCGKITIFNIVISLNNTGGRR